ncbi:CCA tRNA nucleotidyltransferase, partial [Bacillus vallismortis]|nr:CCA tRNA nucleotidyltransferase [Bacillus vallismortis]
INAMAMTAEAKVLDYFCGKKDIDQKLIRTVGKPENRFQEDAIRMLRAVRFMSQLGFTLSPDTEEAIKTEKTLLSHISVERKREELEKL